MLRAIAMAWILASAALATQSIERHLTNATTGGRRPYMEPEPLVVEKGKSNGWASVMRTCRARRAAESQRRFSQRRVYRLAGYESATFGLHRRRQLRGSGWCITSRPRRVVMLKKAEARINRPTKLMKPLTPKSV
jgi:hypothetical protein